jgi:hypothetical protein
VKFFSRPIIFFIILCIHLNEVQRSLFFLIHTRRVVLKSERKIPILVKVPYKRFFVSLVCLKCIPFRQRRIVCYLQLGNVVSPYVLNILYVLPRLPPLPRSSFLTVVRGHSKTMITVFINMVGMPIITAINIQLRPVFKNLRVARSLASVQVGRQH